MHRLIPLVLLVSWGCRSFGVEQDLDGFPAGVDCDDADDGVFPSAQEICNDVDDDCDGRIDEADPTLDLTAAPTFYIDGDDDGFGAQAVQACTEPPGAVTVGGDCDDAAKAVHPDAQEVCNGVDDDCDGAVDDGDESLDPVSATTVWDDDDGDGWGAGEGRARCDVGSGASILGGDCDDLDPLVHPGAVESCNGIDDDCDRAVDDADPSVDPTTRSAFYLDVDQDGWGAGAEVYACAAPAGTVIVSGDCDDQDASVNPDGQEVCDASNVDEDCDGLGDDADPDVDSASRTVFYADGDGDGWGVSANAISACDQPIAFVARDGDCVDTDVDVHPGAAEICNDVDDDCDGLMDGADPDVDASTRRPFFADHDGDGFPGGQAILHCETPVGMSAVATDCDDGAAEVFPGAFERCDGLRNDCLDAGWAGDDGIATLVDGLGVSDMTVAMLGAAPVQVSDGSLHRV